MTTEMFPHMDCKLCLRGQSMRTDIADERPELVFVSSMSLAVSDQRHLVQKVLSADETDEVTQMGIHVFLVVVEKLEFGVAKTTKSLRDFSVTVNLCPVLVLPVL